MVEEETKKVLMKAASFLLKHNPANFDMNVFLRYKNNIIDFDEKMSKEEVITDLNCIYCLAGLIALQNKDLTKSCAQLTGKVSVPTLSLKLKLNLFQSKFLFSSSWARLDNSPKFAAYRVLFMLNNEGGELLINYEKYHMNLSFDRTSVKEITEWVNANIMNSKSI